MTMDKQQERLGSGKKRAPRDNIDLDVIDALAIGYGCQYGRFKADHPLTKDANEPRLAAKKKKPAEPKPPRPPRQRFRNYTKVCKCCGVTFTTTSKGRVYCDTTCRRKAERKRTIQKKGGNKA